jgi:hypothetical protein
MLTLAPADINALIISIGRPIAIATGVSPFEFWELRLAPAFIISFTTAVWLLPIAFCFKD